MEGRVKTSAYKCVSCKCKEAYVLAASNWVTWMSNTTVPAFSFRLFALFIFDFVLILLRKLIWVM